MAVSKRTRFEVLRRDNYTCRYCRSSENALTVDHVTPVALGGTDEPSNLVACCQDCNAGKSSTSPDAATVAQVENDALRWAAAMERAAEERRAKRAANIGPAEEFRRAWEEGIHCDLPANWRSTISRFLDLGLDLAELKDAISVAAARVDYPYRDGDYFRYFCGVCWRAIRELQAASAAIIAEESSVNA